MRPNARGLTRIVPSEFLSIGDKAVSEPQEIKAKIFQVIRPSVAVAAGMLSLEKLVLPGPGTPCQLGLSRVLRAVQSWPVKLMAT